MCHHMATNVAYTFSIVDEPHAPAAAAADDDDDNDDNDNGKDTVIVRKPLQL